ncbi:MAG TPA: winged helix-turn-helix transcriptional regulator [Nitrospiraceae bacterium]|jgi:DNA-binding MarR family transcriptional regulator|nr:winged helix-turn-helix transcriptional regulator [Nitrospiraceae bacterium]
MDIQGQRDLVLLTEVERDAEVTQRSLATKLGVALGLTNLYLKRLARKGYIKLTTIPKHRIRYLLTPRGIAEKSRLTCQYMQYSLSYYREMRNQLRATLAGLSQTGVKRVAICGTGELAELAYLSLREMNLTLVGFVDGRDTRTFLSYPVWPIEFLNEWEFDALLIADLENAKKIQAKLARQGIAKEKILSLGPGRG